MFTRGGTGLVETVSEPNLCLEGHGHRITSVDFHPCIDGLLGEFYAYNASMHSLRINYSKLVL